MHLVSHGGILRLPLAIDDVRKCLCSVYPHKAVNSDIMIPGLVPESCTKVLAEPVTRIVNASLTAGGVPTAFKMSHTSTL